ncbi:MAG: NAD(P)H-dependent oxidoreductase subunit E [Planctomycetales bacterium]|nr:NAD(P)H-dependent oxidoreductase subunit E [Planctomycetales bacterium]
MATAERILTDEMVAAIQALLPRYPTRQAVTLPALHIVNNQLRHVPLAAVVEIAELLELAPAQVQDTLSFYGFFKQDAPHGRTRAWICRSLSCALRGSESLIEHAQQKLGIASGETTPDGRVTLEEAECLGGCDFAPCMLAGGQLHKNLDTAQLDRIIDTWE